MCGPAGRKFAGGSFRPMGALGNPGLEDFDLRFGQAMARGRHGSGFSIGQFDHAKDFAFIRFTRYKEGPVWAGTEGDLAIAQIEIAGRLFPIMTVEAISLQNGLHLAGKELDRRIISIVGLPGMLAGYLE